MGQAPLILSKLRHAGCFLMENVPGAKAVSRGNNQSQNEETGRSRFLQVYSRSAAYCGSGSSTVLLFTAPVSVDVAMAVLLTEPLVASSSLMV